MSLPPCHPQFPGLPTLRRRRGPQYELSRGHRASGLQLNLTWVVNLLEKIPGPHQQRIPSQSRQQTLQAAVTTDGLPHDGVQQGDFRPPHDQHQCCNRCHCCVLPTFHKSARSSLRSHTSQWHVHVHEHGRRRHLQGRAWSRHLDVSAHLGGAVAAAANAPTAEGPEFSGEAVELLVIFVSSCNVQGRTSSAPTSIS